ncbi:MULTISPECIES: hypothetical protein [unclassified Anaeromyxobacter]|uniref:PDC sensor domain-containing protein n=1 Tax=unclassified Anaeromyxobacter TaxID=2620896 RepID=UPI001F58A609|nr:MULTISPECIES: hypothetical protein [unclassified Anaeromyxobacter]
MFPASRGVFGRGLALALAMALASGIARAAPPQAPAEAAAFEVDAKVVLAAFVALADGHLRKMADSLQVLALSEQTRSADWANIERQLGEIAKLNDAALNWFALPDGSYWSVQNGREKGNLSTRAYFPKVLAGETVIGDLVVSKATGKGVAIVAVPVKGRDGVVSGVLGASIYLGKLSARIREEMNVGDDLIFYSFDATPLLAIVWDPTLVFTNPKELGPEVDKAFTEMLSKKEGVVRYTFRERQRTVVFSKSAVTGWWYGFGVVQAPQSARAETPPGKAGATR